MYVVLVDDDGADSVFPIGPFRSYERACAVEDRLRDRLPDATIAVERLWAETSALAVLDPS